MHTHFSLWFILVFIYSNYVKWEFLFVDVFGFPLIIPVFTLIFVKILSVVAFQFDCCIDIKKHSAIINFQGTRVYKPASPGSIACHTHIIVQPYCSFFVRAINTFWYLIWFECQFQSFVFSTRSQEEQEILSLALRN